MPDLRYRIDELFAADNNVGVRWTWTGNNTGTLNGLGPSGRHLENTGSSASARTLRKPGSTRKLSMRRWGVKAERGHFRAPAELQ